MHRFYSADTLATTTYKDGTTSVRFPASLEIGENLALFAKSGVVITKKMLEDVAEAYKKWRALGDAFRDKFNEKTSSVSDPYGTYNEDLKKLIAKKNRASKIYMDLIKSLGVDIGHVEASATLSYTS